MEVLSRTGLLVDLLGPLQVSVDGRAVDVRGGRLRALLVALAQSPRRAVPGTSLVDAVWGDDPPAEAPNALQSLVSRLRAALGDASLVRQVDGGYLLDVAPDAVDVARFERLAREPGRAREALALWRGPLPPGLPEVRLEQLRQQAQAARLEDDVAAGRDATAELQSLLAEQPLREDLAGLLMLALSRQGRQAEALAAYARTRARLADELGADPSSALAARHLEVLQAATAPERALPAPLTRFVGRQAELAQVGERLAGSRLVTVVGPGGAGKTRLVTEAARARPPARTWLVELAPVVDPEDVPAAVASAVGVREAALVDRRTAPREVLDRLVQALSGAGTLLVLDNAEHLLDPVAHLCEALLARCAGLRVLVTSREALGLPGEALVPLAPLEVPAAGSTAEQARTHPSVALFADRAAAVQPGFRVDGTTVADVVELVRRLDGLPLALELAAARLRSLPLAEVVRRLDDRFRLLTGGSRTALPRHRTLRAVVAWSWELLDEDERRLADRASVFPGGLTGASAAAVVDDPDVADRLAALVDKSLLQLVDGPRYRLLETMREYGAERLAEAGELAAVRLAHARWFAALAARADVGLRGPYQLDRLALLRDERDNVLAALRCLTDLGETDAALRLALDLGWYWLLMGSHAEAVAHLRPALALPPGQDPAVRLGGEVLLVLFEQAATGYDSAAPHPELVRDLVRRAGREDLSAHPLLSLLIPIVLFMARELPASSAALDRVVADGDAWLSAAARSFRARFRENTGDLDAVREDLDPAIATFRELGDRWGLTSTLPLAALLLQYDDDLDGAQALLSEAAVLAAELGSADPDDQVFLALRRAEVLLRQGRVAEAEQVMTDLAERVRDAGGEAASFVDALRGAYRRQAGDLDGAEVLQAAAESRLPPPGSPAGTAPHGVAVVRATGAWLALARGDLAAAMRSLVLAHEAALVSHDGPIAALVALACAQAALHTGRPERAAELLGAASRLRGAHDRTSVDVRQVQAAVTAAIGPEGFDAAYDAGWRLDRGSALARTDPAVLSTDTDTDTVPGPAPSPA